MFQQSLIAVSRTPFWMTDVVPGAVAGLFVITGAQASAPPPRPMEAPAVAAIAAAPVPAAEPAAGFVFGEPVAGYDVVSPFGLRKLPWEEHGRLHAGVDIAAPARYPVKAAADGVVVRSGFDGGYGRFVEVRHAAGLVTRYAHLGGIAPHLRPGLAVKLGDRLGQVGSTGTSTGAHLHFEVRRHGRALNPRYFIEAEYEEAKDLPLKAAARVPRFVRVAHVSYIPKAKQRLMQAREEAKAEARLAEAATDLAAEDAVQLPAPLTRVAPAPTAVTEAERIVQSPMADPAPVAPEPAAPQVVIKARRVHVRLQG